MESKPSTSSSQGDKQTEDVNQKPLSPEEARKRADAFLAKMKAKRKPGEQYDAFVRQEMPVAIPERRNRRRSGLHETERENAGDAPEDEGVRLATLAFFTLMALMGFMCTYLLVYVVEPMTRKEQEELMKQARAAGYDLEGVFGDSLLFYKTFVALFVIPAIICIFTWKWR